MAVNIVIHLIYAKIDVPPDGAASTIAATAPAIAKIVVTKLSLIRIRSFSHHVSFESMLVNRSI
jgi:hypothetical protein